MNAFSRVALIVAAVLVAMHAPTASSKAEPAGARAYTIDFHFSAPTPVGCLALGDGAIATCGTLQPNGFVSTQPRWAWIVLTGIPEDQGGGEAGGIRSVSFGIEHSLAEPVWSLCNGGSEMPDATWPASGTGITVTWPDDCYHATASAVGGTRVGILTIASDASGPITVVPNPATGVASVTDCDGVVYELCPGALGVADATPAGDMGVTACGNACATPAASLTWGNIKAAFGR